MPDRFRRTNFAAAGLVVTACLVAYLPALRGEFIWNDADYVTSGALRSWEGLARIWTEFGATEQYYPVLHSAFWVQHWLWGDLPFGYHLVTLLTHAGCAVIFGAVLRRLAVPGAWLAAALFALHPVHVESVAWISEQKNTLSLLFYLAAARTYLEFDGSRRPRAYWIAATFFALALLSKTVAATLPAALLVVFWWQRGRLEWRRDLLPLLPWLVAGAAMGLLSSWVERHHGGAGGEEFSVSWLERVLIAGRAFWFYIGSLVWPFNLNFIYVRWTPDITVFWQWFYPLAMAALATGAWAMRRFARAPFAVLLLFAGSLFPVLGFVNLYGARYSWVWDHWQYLPDLGPIALAGAGLSLWCQGLRERWRLFGRISIAALLALFATLTWQHSRIFHDDETLYLATLRRNPEAWTAHGNLGAMLASDPARRAEAISHFEAALRLKPDSAEIHEGMANVLAGSRSPADQAAAREYYDAALRLDASRATAHNNLGLLHYKAGEPEAAIAAFRRALECNPRLASAAANLGAVLCDVDRPAEAVPVLQRAIETDPSLAATHLALGNAWKALSRPIDAEQSYRAALRLEPHAVDIRIRWAELLLDRNEINPALTLLREAIAQDATVAEAHYHLGVGLCRLGNQTEGVRAFREAIRLDPQWPAPHLALGNALAEARDMSGAIHEFRAVLAIRPAHLGARNNLANALLISGDTAGAIREYEAALRQEPDNADILENLGFARELLRQSTRR